MFPDPFVDTFNYPFVKSHAGGAVAHFYSMVTHAVYNLIRN